METVKETEDGFEFDVKDTPVPFELALLESFSQSSKLIVKGKPLEEYPERFSINFECSELRNTALHLNPRFDEGAFVRNFKNEAGWHPDVDRRGPWLFEPGQEFKMKIMCTNDEFKIKLNGEKIPSFTHKLSPNEVTHLSFDGDVHIKEVTYEPSGSDDAIEFDVKHLAVPMELPLKHNFPPGSKIVIKGTPIEDNPYRFSINFQWPRAIALHFNPRFSEGNIVRNWRNGDGWDFNGEDRSGPWPFAPGEEFELKIKCKDDEFKMKVNGEKVPGFQHKIHPSAITHVMFEGDVKISKVKYNPAR